MNRRIDDYLGVPRVRKVKHLKFIFNSCLEELEEDFNKFVDEHPKYKILGARLMEDSGGMFILTVTYLEDSGGFNTYEDKDDSYED